MKRAGTKEGFHMIEAQEVSVTETTILLAFFDSCRRAKTLAEVNIAAGVARQNLLDLAEDTFDHLRELFEVAERA